MHANSTIKLILQHQFMLRIIHSQLMQIEMAEGSCKYNYILILDNKFENGFLLLKDLKRDFLLPI